MNEQELVDTQKLAQQFAAAAEKLADAFAKIADQAESVARSLNRLADLAEKGDS